MDEETGEVLKGKVIKFGWLEGVLMRCMLNIWQVNANFENELLAFYVIND